MLRLGFIGTGTLVESVIGSLQKHRGDQYWFFVSPRSETRSRSLAAEYSNVQRMRSNAEIVEQSDIVFLGMRPQQLDAAVAGLRFRSAQIIVSTLANTPHSLLLSRVAPATRVCRVIPTAAVKYCKGPVTVYPRDAVVEDIFRDLGELIVVDLESDLAAVSQASALMSSHFQLQNTVVKWLLSRDVAPPTATAYVRSMFRGFAEITLAGSPGSEPMTPEEYETRGGLNECARRFLGEAGWFDQVTRALNAIEALKPAEPRQESIE